MFSLQCCLLLSFPSKRPRPNSIRLKFFFLRTTMSKRRDCCLNTMLLFSGARTVDLDDVFGDVNKLVDESLPVNFGQNTALIIVSVTAQRGERNRMLLFGRIIIRKDEWPNRYIPQRSAHRFVVHVGLVFVETP